MIGEFTTSVPSLDILHSSTEWPMGWEWNWNLDFKKSCLHEAADCLRFSHFVGFHESTWTLSQSGQCQNKKHK